MSRDELLATAVAAALGRSPETIHRLPGGANNVVARAVVDGRPVLVKLYFRHPGDLRDRLGTEFGVLEFLWSNGVRCVPQPLAMNRDHSVGVYEFVEGMPPSAAEVSWSDVMQLADLLGEMWRLRDRPGAGQIPEASEATFSLRDYWKMVEARLDRMSRALVQDPAVAAVHAFLQQQLVPLAGRVRAFVEGRASGLGLRLEESLAPSQRTLNPADHGFHNTLRRADGRLVFLDFEYAGWDDPAQMLANACLMPQVPLPGQFRLNFLRHMLDRLGASGATAARLRLIYPMLALKWCLIMLNEFVPVAGVRRTFAGANDPDRRAQQFGKAQKQLLVVEEALSGACFLDVLPEISRGCDA